MAQVFVTVGSNINPCENIIRALQLLKNNVNCEAVSNFYATEPIGRLDQPSFVNGAFLISTNLSPRELKFSVLQKIELMLERKRTLDKYAPRTIDLDIALYDQWVIDESDIVIPDPDIYTRAFVAVPIYEIGPELIIPDTMLTIKEVAAKLDTGKMTKLDAFTDKLRMEL